MALDQGHFRHGSMSRIGRRRGAGNARRLRFPCRRLGTVF
jgi:hypothetical protein